MNPFKEDPRMKTARRGLWLAWAFFSAYLVTILLTSHLLGVSPMLWGLPRWVAIGNIVVPVVFVLLLILVVEQGIPDIPLDDREGPIEDAPRTDEGDRGDA
jgi:uncharacterized membrane protein YhdT